MKDYQELKQEIQKIIRNHPDQRNTHDSASAILEHILSINVICNHNPIDTKIYTISMVSGLLPYPFKRDNK